MDDVRGVWVTLSLCAFSILVYVVDGPATVSRAPIPLPEVFANVFRHGNLGHLITNCALLIFGGYVTERAIGTWRTLLLVSACVVVGTLTQLALVDHRFVGISGPVYGVVAFAVLSTTEQKNWWLLCIAAVVVLGLEVALKSDTIAIYPHVLSTVIGGTYAMFGSLFGSKGPKLKPMQLAHVPAVVAIINETDDDDAAEAEQSFINDGLGGMFVLVEGSTVIGVTGYSPDDQVNDIAWLSWTYLRGDRTSEGLGSMMMNDMLGKLKDAGVRKLFIATSDYEDFGKPIYAAAHRMYEEFGAEVELTVPAYHTPTEAKIVYALENPEYQPGGQPLEAANTGIAVTGSAREPETEGVAGLTWDEAPVGLAGVDFALDKARSNGARMAVIALPSDLSDHNAAAIRSHGFEVCGKLTDYYNLGLHQIWWVCSLDAK